MTPKTLRSGIAVATLLTLTAFAVPAAAAHQPSSTRGAHRAWHSAGVAQTDTLRAAKGPWVLVSKGQNVPSGTPAAWLADNKTGYLMWMTHPTSTKYTYDVVTVSPSGKVSTASDVFPGKHWDSLTFQPTLVGNGNTPTVVFNGGRGTADAYNDGCVYGATGTSWTLQTWSLSHGCINPIGGAASSGTTLAAAWPGSNAVTYRIGTSPSIPASGSDSSAPISGTGDIYRVSMTSNPRDGDFYLGWAQEFSNPASKDGFYAKDVSASNALVKMPNTGTNAINHLSGFANVAITSTTHGVFMAACDNGTTCKLQLWKVGAAKAKAIPSSTEPFSVSMSAGPSGRLWLSWYDAESNKVKVSRTNMADTKFGPIQSLSTDCAEHGLLGLAGGDSGRLDLGMECINNSLVSATYATSILAPLSLSLSSTKVSNKSSHKITATVTDVGDPVAGAVVTYGKHKATTNAKGKATFTVAKKTKPGKYSISATAKDYLAAHRTLQVTG